MINTTEAPTMRLQLALNVKDLDEAIDFYTRMFDTPPTKLRPGYANFAIANPPLKLVLFEGDEAGTINHLGVETSTATEVVDAEARLTESGLETTGVDDTVCCFAEKTETWLAGPDATRWEWYVRTGDSESLVNHIISGANAATTACCPADLVDAASEPASEPATSAKCC